MPNISDTIAAVATPPGKGAIGVLRLSGPEALEIGARVWEGKDPRKLPGGRFTYGRLKDPETGEVIDEGLLLVFRAPHSYTGEDALEFQLHGSPAVMRRGITALLKAGARLAEPGEYTLRAYLRGKLDLAQAESVLALVEAESETARRQALRGLSRELSRKIAELEEPLLDLLAHIQATLDYPEEGVEPHRAEEVIKEALSKIEALLKTAQAGRIAREGARLVILGPPNAGKSSLLNALLGYERAIVTPIPGTTRDYLEAPLELEGLPIKAVDTAGVRETEDPVEAAGVARALELAKEADLVLWVADQSGKKPTPPPELQKERTLFVASKADLPPAWEDPGYLRVSTKTGEGLSELKRAIKERLLAGASEGEAWLTSERQAEALLRAKEHLLAALGAPDDLMAMEVEAALEALAQVTGREVVDEAIDRIFKNFCVGK